MIKLFLQSLLFVVFVFIWAACSSTDVTTVSMQDFIHKSLSDEGSTITKLATGDSIELSVEVDGRMEVSRHRVGIDYFGAVTLPLVGDVKIGGLKMDEARRAISRAYGAYYVNPPVVMLSTVEDIDAGEWGFITITGRVGRPGLVRIPDASGIKLTAVIQEAGGFSGSAKVSDIRVSRVDSSGEKIQVSVNYNEIGIEGNADADIALMDGDIVYVPERIF